MPWFVGWGCIALLSCLSETWLHSYGGLHFHTKLVSQITFPAVSEHRLCFCSICCNDFNRNAILGKQERYCIYGFHCSRVKEQMPCDEAILSRAQPGECGVSLPCPDAFPAGEVGAGFRTIPLVWGTLRAGIHGTVCLSLCCCWWHSVL